MKILIVSQHFYPETFSINDIAFELQKRGHKVSVVAGLPNYGYKEIPKEYLKIKYEVINDVEVFRIKHFSRKESRISIILNYISFWHNSKRFLSHFDDKYDVILSFCMSPIIASSGAIIYRNDKKIPHIHYVMDLWPESVVVTGASKRNSLMYKILYKWSKHIYHNCDSFIISSPSFKNYLTDVIKINNENTITYINQPSIIKEASGEIVNYKHKFNLVYCGNIGKLQLVDLYVKAIKELDDKYDVGLTLIGMGSMSNEVNNLIKEYKLEHKINYVGPKPAQEAARYYESCDAFIAGLKDEGYVGKTIPNKVSQYMYFGKPIIGVFNGDAKELLENAGGNIICEENVDSIKNAIIKLYETSTKDLTNLGQKNNKYFNEFLSINKIIDQIEFKLNSLVKK